MIDVFNSKLLDEYRQHFVIWHRIAVDDPYGGYDSQWVKGASFDGIITEDASLTATVAGLDTKKNYYGIKVKRDAPLDFQTIFRSDKDGKWYRITSGDVLKSPSISALDMKILSCEAFDPIDWTEPKPEPKEETNGNA